MDRQQLNANRNTTSDVDFFMYEDMYPGINP